MSAMGVKQYRSCINDVYTLTDIAILNIRGDDYRCCIINWITKSDTVNLLQNPDVTEEREKS